VSTLVPVAGFGLKEAVTPLGSPDAESITLPVNPPEGVTVTVLVADAPGATIKLSGLADNEKPGVTGAEG
jgi:hypothetical protein